MSKMKNTSQFIAEAIATHGNKYDYSKVNYTNCYTKVCIICPTHGEFWQDPSTHLKGSGCVHCGTSKVKRRVLHGVAFVDIDNANSIENRKAYSLWVNMLARCYSPYVHKRLPTYIGCSVCEEWLLFSNFKKWFDDNYVEGYDLDKDVLVKGNTIYGPSTCCFIPHKLNCSINKCQGGRRKLPIGVCFDTSRGKYVCSFRRGMKHKHIGRFESLNDAFLAYKAAKEEYIKELAEEYYQECKITKKVYDALMKYEVEITD